MNLRKGAKPREILVNTSADFYCLVLYWYAFKQRRCYVFEGCVSGSDIVKWLTTKGMPRLHLLRWVIWV